MPFVKAYLVDVTCVEASSVVLLYVGCQPAAATNVSHCGCEWHSCPNMETDCEVHRWTRDDLLSHFMSLQVPWGSNLCSQNSRVAVWSQLTLLCHATASRMSAMGQDLLAGGVCRCSSMAQILR